MSAPDPRPIKRHKADVDEWKILRKLKLGPCRVCGAIDRPVLFGVRVTLHHLVPRSLGGGDVPANLVPLCGSGTTGCHGAVESREKPACAILGNSLTADEIAYVITTKGAHFFDRYFRPGVEDMQTHERAAASSS